MSCFVRATYCDVAAMWCIEIGDLDLDDLAAGAADRLDRGAHDLVDGAAPSGVVVGAQGVGHEPEPRALAARPSSSSAR